MPVNLHPDARRRLIEALATELPNLQVWGNVLLKYPSTAGLQRLNTILPGNRDFRAQLESYVSEEPLSDFIADRLECYLHEDFEYDKEAPESSLVLLPGFNDATALAERLVTEFESLPWQYSIFVQLPRSLGSKVRPILQNRAYQFCDSLQLVVPDENLLQQFPPQPNPDAQEALIPLTLLLHPLRQNEESLYLRASVSGYISRYGGTFPFNEYQLLLRSFCGLAVTHRFAEIGTSQQRLPPRVEAAVFRMNGDDGTFHTSRSLSPEFSRAFWSLTLGDIITQQPDANEQASLIRGGLAAIADVLRRQHTEETKRLLRSSQWYFDSHCGENDLLSFVQATIVLEILLGDKAASDIVGLGTLLGNRCAYMVGKSNREREQILRDFIRIYDTRSRIVHRGKAHLSKAEAADLYKLRWLCRRVLTTEIELIRADTVR